MAEIVASKETALAPPDVIMRAVQFFTTGKWRTQSQSERIATFAGRPPIPVMMIIMTFIGFMLCIVPGILLYILVIRRMIQLQNIVVTATPLPAGAQVVIKHSDTARQLVSVFLEALPPLTATL